MFSFRKLTNKGQATVEYLLLLMVLVFLFRVIGGPLIKNIALMGSSLLSPGGYYACLMEKGLLPGFAYQGGEGSQCSYKKAEALAALENQGEGILGGEGADSYGAREKLADLENGKTARPKKRKKRKFRSSSKKRKKRGEGSSGYEGDSRGGGRGKYASRVKKPATQGRGPSGRSSGGESSEEENPKDSYVKVKKGSSSGEGRGIYRRGRGYLGVLAPEEEERPPAVFKTRTHKTQALPRSKKNSRIKAPLKQERKLQAEEEEPLGLAGFLKYLFIAAIVIVILVVIGSQVIEFTNKE